ncbi:MAG TPA: helicase C-terminal domain-containing protein [bacterium]|nr:helicase C-terminal domain-containing protein [bacterium]
MSASSVINSGQTLVFLDVETTGRDPRRDRIIEVGCLKVSNNQARDRWQSLVQSSIGLPLAIQRLTGITRERLEKEGQPWEEIKPQLREFVDGFPIVGHNISFDLSFLQSHGLTLANPVYDTCELACLLYPCLGHYSLAGLLTRFGYQAQQIHRAFSDCENTYHLWCRLLDNLKPEDAERIEEIRQLLSGLDWPLEEIFARLAEYLRQQKQPAGAAEVSEKIKESSPLLLPDFSSLFEPGGLLSQHWPEYELRPQQKEMADLVQQAFRERKYLLIEAGTGTGKSLAYLLPAVYHARKNSRKAVVSTNTKNLQDQLWYKEIPFLQKCLPGSFTAALVKGRENYLCWRRWDALLRSELPLFPEDKRGLAYLTSWIKQTETGLLEEVSSWYLSRVPGLREIIEQLRSEEEGCLLRKCPWQKMCFYQRMKQKAHQADLILTNHALIFSGPLWFPDFTELILDEAHNVEDVATEVFSREVSSLLLERTLFWLDERHRYNRMRPFWQALRKVNLLPEQSWQPAREKLAEKITGLQQLLAVLTTGLLSLVPEKKSLLWKDLVACPAWPQVKVSAENFLLVWRQVEKILQSLKNSLKAVSLKSDSMGEAFLHLTGLSERWGKIREEMEFLFSEEKPGYVFYLETEAGKEGKTYWQMKAAPLEPGKLLQAFYRERESIVFTSATLTVAGDFSFLLQRLGLDSFPEEKILTRVLGSPFNYRRSVLLAVPEDFPGFSHEQPAEFLAALREGIFTAASVTRGKILVLFNSRERMQHLYADLKEKLESEKIMLLCQGIDGSRKHLAEMLSQSQEATVLFGTKSFREGVDISGLTGVILEKLPFASPDEPVIAGRRQDLFRKGKDAWQAYLLPLATIALRQAFGRLIRKKTDRGFFIVFDARLLTSFQVMKNSLPVCQEFFQPLERFSLDLTQALTQLERKDEETD